MGTRDSERSLVAPEVIFIGDSYTLGWGVNQSDAFPQQFAALTGKKTLNAGISSYGTAREMLLLQRLITRDTRHIVLQYCFNDLQENRQYVDADFSLKVMSEKDYLKRSQRLRYYPGRYCVILYFHLRHNIKAAFKKNEPVATEDKTVEVQYFLRTLAHHKALLADRRLSVLVCPADKKFLATLRKELGSMKELQDLAIELIDTSEILNPNDQYVIDEHYKASGHKKIAELLAAGPSAGNAANRTAVRGK
jgi:uncharacterized protein YbaR (Trm112 family)